MLWCDNYSKTCCILFNSNSNILSRLNCFSNSFQTIKLSLRSRFTNKTLSTNVKVTRFVRNNLLIDIEMLVLATLLILCVVYVLVNYYKTLCLWKDKGIRYVSPLPIFGNSLPTFLQSVTYPEYVVDLYKQFPEERYCGTFQYTQPILLLRDLNLIKRIFIKQFNTFSEHPLFSDPDKDALWGKNLFAANGERWRQLRQVISPVFATGNLKSMFGLMDKCARQLMEYLNEKDKDIIEIELRDLFKRYSTDTIASIAFGIDSNSYKDVNNDFIRMGAELTNFGGLQKLKRLLYTVNPKIAKLLNVKMHPDNVAIFFRKLIKDSIQYRENEKTARPDYIQHLLECRKGHFKEIENLSKTSETEYSVVKESHLGPRNKRFALELTEDDITAQALDFFYGGFYSTASLMYFCVYELAMNPEVQEKLRKEVDETLKGGCETVDYDNLTKMKYLDMVISETLRKWPTATWIDRKSNKPIVIEPELSKEKPLYLEAGTVCWIPVFAIQRDPKYWPDPEKFDPERFHEDNRSNIFASSFLPFGAGPRCCVGSRFAIVEAKLIIVYILSIYEIVPTEKSNVDRNPYLTSGDSFWFGFKKRSNK